ncbi:hypothetical protein ON010_g7066 [Phytophthora cinnamomi]|nr:hypothetical protein ON010_g7066 [Phytophthora cinnamomi]
MLAPDQSDVDLEAARPDSSIVSLLACERYCCDGGAARRIESAAAEPEGQAHDDQDEAGDRASPDGEAGQCKLPVGSSGGTDQGDRRRCQDEA